MIAAVLWFFAGAFVGPIAVTLINMALTSAGTGIALALRNLSKPGRTLRLIFSFGSAAALYGVLSWIGIRTTQFMWDLDHTGFKWGLIIASIVPAIMCVASLIAIPGSIATAPDEELEDEAVKGEVPLKLAFGFYVGAILIYFAASSFYIETVEVTPENQEYAEMLDDIVKDPVEMVNFGKGQIALGMIDEGIAVLEEAGRLFPGNELVEDAIRQAQEDFGK